jgi:hypothetical protein
LRAAAGAWIKLAATPVFAFSAALFLGFLISRFERFWPFAMCLSIARDDGSDSARDSEKMQPDNFAV